MHPQAARERAPDQMSGLPYGLLVDAFHANLRDGLDLV
jgi:hypothetical protein